MKHRIKFLLTTLVLITAGLVVTSPQASALQADVSVSSGWVHGCGEWWGPFRGSAFVTLKGDYVTVRDACADGRGVKATISMNGESLRTCSNSKGAGHEVVCNYDWPEGFRGMKTIVFYFRTSPGGSSWTMGQVAHWRDG